MDKIILKIRCSSETREQLRDDGLFFETTAGVLDIGRDDVIEVD